MKKACYLVLILVCLLVSCTQEPPVLTNEADCIAAVGIHAVNEIIKDGNLKGYTKTILERANYHNMSNVSITVDLGSINSKWGTQTVVVSGQLSVVYDEEYPSEYPRTTTYNISYSYMGVKHTLELKIRATGISSSQYNVLKVDGVEYRMK